MFNPRMLKLHTYASFDSNERKKERDRQTDCRQTDKTETYIRTETDRWQHIDCWHTETDTWTQTDSLQAEIAGETDKT